MKFLRSSGVVMTLLRSFHPLERELRMKTRKNEGLRSIVHFGVRPRPYSIHGAILLPLIRVDPSIEESLEDCAVGELPLGTRDRPALAQDARVEGFKEP